MSDDLLRACGLDDQRVAAAIAPWRIERVIASTMRAAVEVVLIRPGFQRVLARLEPRIAGADHLAATATLHLSYYAEDGVDHTAAAAVVRALAAALHAAEAARTAPRRSLPVVTGRDRTAIELRINRACNERCRHRADSERPDRQRRRLRRDSDRLQRIRIAAQERE